uniref:Receptor expression-enhancing protein n=1 Tax=Cyprinodon variegatus TaxID=28743 RepID=A0A3Q2CMX4_CYPVA
MMYWIVFALYTVAETITDLTVAWFPLYYELKIAFVIWLLSPYTRGASLIYRKCLHPLLSSREREIDEYIVQAKEKSYVTMVNFGKQGLSIAATAAVTAAVKNCLIVFLFLSGRSTPTAELCQIQKNHSDPSDLFCRQSSALLAHCFNGIGINHINELIPVIRFTVRRYGGNFVPLLLQRSCFIIQNLERKKTENVQQTSRNVSLVRPSKGKAASRREENGMWIADWKKGKSIKLPGKGKVEKI